MFGEIIKKKILLFFWKNLANKILKMADEKALVFARKNEIAPRATSPEGEIIEPPSFLRPYVEFYQLVRRANIEAYKSAINFFQENPEASSDNLKEHIRDCLSIFLERYPGNYGLTLLLEKHPSGGHSADIQPPNDPLRVLLIKELPNHFRKYTWQQKLAEIAFAQFPSEEISRKNPNESIPSIVKNPFSAKKITMEDGNTGLRYQCYHQPETGRIFFINKEKRQVWYCPYDVVEVFFKDFLPQVVSLQKEGTKDQEKS